MTDHCIPGIERPACFEIVPTARAVSGAGKKRRSRFVTRQSIRTAFATVAREDAWSMRTVLDLHQGRTRSDLLFTMSNNTRIPRRTQVGVNLCHFWTSETGCPQRVGALFFRMRL